MLVTKDQASSELQFVGFNQDYGCFACGTANGFRIYNVDPFKETFRRVFSNGGVGIVEMLFRCNLLALVGGGRNPRYPPNMVMIWDDHQNRCIGQLSFRSDVKAVKLRRDRVVVALALKIYVYRFSDLKLLDQINTIKNDSGLVALCPDSSHMVLACPGISKGHLNVELYDIRKSTLIPAHESELAQICLNSDGSRVATASDKGTLIRIFDTNNGKLLQELRRGMDRAEIYSIAFNQPTTFLACSSDRGTVHIFSLKGGRGKGSSGGRGGDGDGEEDGRRLSQGGRERGEGLQQGGGGGGVPGEGGVGGGKPKNARSGLSFIPKLLPGVPKYFDSEWSYAQVRGLEAKSICAFGHAAKTVVVVSADGSFLTASFEEPGECERKEYAKFLTNGGDGDEGFGNGLGAGNALPPPLGYPSAAPTPTSLSSKEQVEPEEEGGRQEAMQTEGGGGEDALG